MLKMFNATQYQEMLLLFLSFVLPGLEHSRRCAFIIFGVCRVSKSSCYVLQARWRQFRISVILKYFFS